MTRHELFAALKAGHGFWQETSSIRRCRCGHRIKATSAFLGWNKERKHLMEKLHETNRKDSGENA